MFRQPHMIAKRLLRLFGSKCIHSLIQTKQTFQSTSGRPSKINCSWFQILGEPTLRTLSLKNHSFHILSDECATNRQFGRMTCLETQYFAASRLGMHDNTRLLGIEIDGCNKTSIAHSIPNENIYFAVIQNIWQTAFESVWL